MDRITAPYGFVPVSSKVVHPAWAQPRKEGEGLCAPPLHDVPFQDGICGGLEVTVTAETPIFIRGAGGRDSRHFFAMPDGRPAIPGTSLNGYLRNLVEIVTFGRLYDRVNDHRYAVRDLEHPRPYRNFMSTIAPGVASGKPELTPLVNAGWLRVQHRAENGDRTYEIEVADFAKIEYGYLKDVAAARSVRGFEPGEKQSSVKKYTTWGSASLVVDVEITPIRADQVNNVKMPSQYGSVKSINGPRQGTLVFTGQPSAWRPGSSSKRKGGGKTKHHDFVFCPHTPAKIYPIEPAVFADFEFAHSDRGQQNNLGRSEKPNPEWERWRGELDRKQPVPVFFILDEKDPERVRAFGLAMMFRLPYRQSIGDAVRNAQPEAGGDEVRFDFADGLFGTVRQLKGGRSAVALKGRVSVSHALALGQPREEQEIKVVLGQPRASYYPNYVEQDPAHPGASAEAAAGNDWQYTTWQDDGVRPRGWKLYRKATKTWKPPRPTGSGGRQLDQSRVETHFHPLPAGTKFRARIDLHNVRPEELGALLWVMNLGGVRDARHSIGMARPLGYGLTRIEFKAGSDLTDVQGKPVDLERCRDAFVKYMEKQIPGWAKSFEITELLELHRPVSPELVKYQELDPGSGTNEFRDAKQAGLALASVLGAAGPQHPPRAAEADRQERRPREVTQPGGSPASGARSGGRAGASGSARANRGGRAANHPGGSGFRGNAPARPQSNAGPRAGLDPKKAGSDLDVTLTQKNKKGKWQASADNGKARGTIEGTPPADAAPGKKYTVKVIQGGDPTNMNLRWPG